MIEEICRYLNNYFVKERKFGEFTIRNGKLSEDITDGQYFRIIGSVFNDAVYQMSDSLELKDETFDGSIWLMAMPPDVISLSVEIEDWIKNNEKALNTPFQSESFGGYSYSLKTSDGKTVSWQGQFKDRLKGWRKVCPYC